MNGKNLFFKSVSFFLLFAVLLSTTAIYVGAEDDIPDTSFAENICLYNVNTEKIITVNGIYPDGSNNHARSMINTTESTAIFIRETPEEIAAMCNQNQY